MADPVTTRSADVEDALNAATRAAQRIKVGRLKFYAEAKNMHAELPPHLDRRAEAAAMLAAFLSALPAAVFHDYGSLDGVPHTHALANLLEANNG